MAKWRLLQYTVVQLFTVGGLIRGDDTGPSSKSYAQNVGGVVVFLIKVVKSIAVISLDL